MPIFCSFFSLLISIVRSPPNTLHYLLHWNHGPLNYGHDDRRGLLPRVRVERQRFHTFGIVAVAAPVGAVGPVAGRGRRRRALLHVRHGAGPPVVAAAARSLAAARVVVVARGVGVQVLGLRDPVEVAAQVLLDLLPLAVLLEVSAGLGLLTLLGKLSRFARAELEERISTRNFSTFTLTESKIKTKMIRIRREREGILPH